MRPATFHDGLFFSTFTHHNGSLVQDELCNELSEEGWSGLYFLYFRNIADSPWKIEKLLFTKCK